MLRIIQTENGLVRGLPAADPRITSFKGIPFAAPPVGENRWRAPQPCADWEGIRDCYTFAPISVQDTPALGTDIYCREWHVDSEIPMGEDNLYLNIWTSTRTGDEKMPVLVWYFGGGFQWGYTAEMEFDGERLARRGIVVVTVNYRLGALGFLAHPELTAQQPDAPANFGSLDQQYGLEWVIRNIAAFGGDPKNITIAGQSAGGGSVMAQMACNKNEGRFQKAIVLSGMIRPPYAPNPFMVPKTLAEAEKLGTAFFDFLGVKTLAEARALDPFYIRDKYAAFRTDHSCMFTIIQDNCFCDDDPMLKFARGTRVRVPVMAGNTGNEFCAALPAKDEAELREMAEKVFGDKAGAFLSFPEAHQKTGMGFAPVSAIESAVKAAFLGEEKQKDPNACYYYLFDPDIPGDDDPGTFHSCDLWFWFETLAKCSRAYRGHHYDLARQMSMYWVNFIRTGDPNGNDADGTPLPRWESYSSANRGEMHFLSEGAVPAKETSAFKSFLNDELLKTLE
ncbi:MAG: carboxylesterase family protein [Clostridia bacterium]|nr:carboxylesterase family protein [Clostridia bacterium]